MKFLHTSDLHIGKRLDKKPRIDEQVKVINNLVNIVKEKAVDVVLIAGDVFDTFMPSAEAEGVFFDMLYKLSKLNVLTVVISGNHDDDERLTASRQISSICGVFFTGSNFANNTKIGNVEVEKSGENFLVVKKGNERVFISLLPYPTEYRMKDKFLEDETYEQKVSRYISNSIENNTENLPVVLVSHIFMLGGVASSQERSIELGGARILPQTIIPPSCVYTALGHIHKRQVINKDRNVIYSGSIMPYSFDEVNSQKSVTVFEIENGKVQNLEEVKLEGYKELIKISVPSVEDAIKMIDALNDCFIECTLKLDEIISKETLTKLTLNYPNVFFKLEYKTGEVAKVAQRSKMSDKDIFVEFYKSKFSTQPPEELVDLFLEILNDGGVSDETY